MIQPLEEVNVNADHGGKEKLSYHFLTWNHFSFFTFTFVNSDALNVSNTWRQELSKIDIWYATFGSNMSKSRFLCYIEGGQVGQQNSLTLLELLFLCVY